ncbi:MAG: hypothetical protein ACK56F_08100, partial [bacterium]
MVGAGTRVVAAANDSRTGRLSAPGVARLRWLSLLAASAVLAAAAAVLAAVPAVLAAAAAVLATGAAGCATAACSVLAAVAATAV